MQTAGAEHKRCLGLYLTEDLGTGTASATVCGDAPFELWIAVFPVRERATEALVGLGLLSANYAQGLRDLEQPWENLYMGVRVGDAAAELVGFSHVTLSRFIQ